MERSVLASELRASDLGTLGDGFTSLPESLLGYPGMHATQWRRALRSLQRSGVVFAEDTQAVSEVLDRGDRCRLAWTTMSTQHAAVDKLTEKIRELPPDKQAEVEDFVDFLRLKNEERGLAQAAASLSEEAFGRVWDNPEDAAYDRL
jgi:hypothetical protein